MFKIKKRNSTLIILAFIMFVNALSSGIIIPLLYPYSSKFGINPLGLSLLFASYSLFQFLATPIIGRLADRFGRKPMLLISIFGTSLSLALFALAQSVQLLFIARILDGITGGNMSVAQAMIVDETSQKNRAKGFGILGAMFGLGMLIGPAIGGLMSEISLSAPFWFASFLALLLTIFGLFILRETLPKKFRLVKRKPEPFFNYKLMISSLLKPTIGLALFLTFIAYFAHQSVVIGFQAYTVDELKLDPKTIGMIFAAVGIVLILMKSVGLKVIIDRVSSNRKIISMAFLGSAIAIFFIPLAKNTLMFSIIMMTYVAIYSLISPVVTSIISKRVKQEDQGVVLGINQSYASLGQVLGPVSAGLVSQFSVKLVFVWSSIVLLIGFTLASLIKKSSNKVDL